MSRRTVNNWKPIKGQSLTELFERLRSPFGGDRPSQTPHLTLSPSRITAAG